MITADPASVPQNDPGAGVRAQSAAIRTAMDRVLESGRFVLGEEVEAFERAFGAWLGRPEVVTCASGTDALELALRACGVRAGEAVATVSHTAAATVAAVERAGAVPWLLDVEPTRCTLDPGDLRRVLESGAPIRAVVAVHLYGGPADLDALQAICAEHRLALVEDCSQAHGARWRGRRVGAFGDAAAFSFYPTKNLGALGDGGAVAFADPDAAERARRLRQYGWSPDRVCREPGFNSRLDALQAAVLGARLPGLDATIDRRRAVAAAYDEALCGSELEPPVAHPLAEHAFHQYVVQADDRDGVRHRLAAAGVATAIHYTPPVHLHPAYRERLSLGPARCRVTERLADRVLSLPMFPELTDAQVERVCNVLRRC